MLPSRAINFKFSIFYANKKLGIFKLYKSLAYKLNNITFNIALNVLKILIRDIKINLLA